MRFEWDEAKNQINICKHGIDFSDVPDMFQTPCCCCEMIGRPMVRSAGSA